MWPFNKKHVEPEVQIPEVQIPESEKPKAFLDIHFRNGNMICFNSPRNDTFNRFVKWYNTKTDDYYFFSIGLEGAFSSYSFRHDQISYLHLRHRDKIDLGES